MIRDDDLDAHIADFKQLFLTAAQRTETRDDFVDLPDAEVDQRICDLESTLPESQGL